MSTPPTTSTTPTPAQTTPSSIPPLHLLLSSLSLSLQDIAPAVTPLLLHILQTQTAQTLIQAKKLAQHAERTEINMEDLKLAKMMTNAKKRNYIDCTREAEKKNLKPLPIISEKTSFRLPPENYCIAGATYQLVRT